MFLADKASDDGSGIWCSKGTIHRHTELGESTVKRAVGELVQQGILVETGQRRRCKHGYTIIYHMNLAIVKTLEFISNPDEEVDINTGSRTDGDRIKRGTGSAPDGGPGPERTPNHPKTILKPPTRERAKAAAVVDARFEKIWAAYPMDRQRGKATCLARIADAVTEGVDPDDLLRAVQTYATESAGFTRSKVCFSDNWFQSRRWLVLIEKIKAEREAAQAAQANLYARLVGWITDCSPLCKHITPAQVAALIKSNLVTKEQLQAAGLAI